MRIGLFGGTFNPPHNAHVEIVKAAKTQLALDELYVMPCGIPPHKECDVDKSARFIMSQLAFSEYATVSDYEINKGGKSFTLETLERLRTLYPQAELFLVIGGDSLQNFGSWHCPEKIAELAQLAVADRKDSKARALAEETENKYGAKVTFLNVEPNGVSSTEIRLRYQFGWDNSAFVPEAAEKYVKENGLYTDYREIVEKVKTYLSEKRLLHTFYVIKRGLELSFGYEKEKVFLACLLHDVAKYVPESKYDHYGYENENNTPEPVVHSYLGALVAQKDFGVTDCEILDAIRYHTTARPNMTRLDKIVYVADKTEETRPYAFRELLCGDLDETFVRCLVKANEYKNAVHGEEDDDPLTRQALEFYVNGGF